jgi:hypothetical protein
VNRLLTRDPASGEELVVTRLWCPSSGVTIEGEFGLGWMGKLSPDQLDFIGLLLRARNNLQRLAAELGVSYNTARSRMDEIVDALSTDVAAEARGGGRGTGQKDPLTPAGGSSDNRMSVLEALASGEITHEQALRELRR